MTKLRSSTCMFNRVSIFIKISNNLNKICTHPRCQIVIDHTSSYIELNAPNTNYQTQMTLANLILYAIFLVSTLAVLDRTYYNALKLPVSASPEQIKDAYRKLSRKYHPDRNPKSRSRFEKINIAYETLANPEQKFLYDRVGHEKMKNPNIQQEVNLQSLKGSNIEVKLSLTLNDLYMGKEITTTVFKKMACPHCKGSGAQNSYDIVRCAECQGQGKKNKQVPVGNGFYNMVQEVCPRCQGEGNIVGRKCSVCNGDKIIPNSEDFKVTIEPGSSNYDILKYPNMGEERLQGAPGDIWVRLQEIPHPYFVRNGDHLSTSVTIELRQALAGWERSVVQLDGRSIAIGNRGVTQPGQVFTVEGEGMPIKGSEQKGNLYVSVKVAIPDYTDEEVAGLTALMDTYHK